jgi:L-threonylcarbamoyladenylate synthase
VLPRAPDCRIAPLVSAGLPTVALRNPNHRIARELIEIAGVPLAAPSANPSGKITATTAAHVAAALGGKVDLILDGGQTEIGVESTILGFDLEKVVLLRPGGVPRAAIEAITGPLAAPETGKVSAPGMLKSHYAPRAALRLNAAAVEPNEALLAFGPPLPGAKLVRNLSPAGDPLEAASNLFAMLHELDGLAARIAAMPVPETGLGEAINDRLRRAAAPRPR